VDDAPTKKDDKKDDKKGGGDSKFPSKLFKKGATGRKTVESRYVKLEGSTLSYFKSESQLKSNKGAKKN